MKETNTKERYIEAMGRRKTSQARVRITPDTKQSILINELAFAEHFPTKELQHTVGIIRLGANTKETKMVISVPNNGD